MGFPTELMQENLENVDDNDNMFTNTLVSHAATRKRKIMLEDVSN